MAYAALFSLKRTIDCLVNSSHVSFPLPCPEIELLYWELCHLAQFSQVAFHSARNSSKISSAFDAFQDQLRDSIYKLEVVFDSHVSNQFLSQSDHENHADHADESTSHPPSLTTLILIIDIDLQPDINFFIKTSEEMMNDYSKANFSTTNPRFDVDCLKSSIQRLQNSSQISISPPCPQIEYLYDELLSLEKYLVLFDERGMRKSTDTRNALYTQITESLQKLADVIESRVSTQFSSQSQIGPGPGPGGDQETAHPSTFSTDLHEFLERIFILESNSIKQSREATLRLQDAVHQFLSESGSSLGDESSQPFKFILDLTDLSQDIHSFTTRVKEIEEEDAKRYYPASISLPEDINLYNPIDLNSFTTMMKKIKEVYITEPPKLSNLMPVGLHDQFIQLRSWLANDTDNLQAVSIVGMAGIGKTTLAKHVYEDPFILDHFCDRVWVTVGQRYEYEETMMRILAQPNPEINQNDVKGNENIEKYVTLSLEHRRYLIVLDDIWDTVAWFSY